MNRKSVILWGLSAVLFGWGLLLYSNSFESAFHFDDYQNIVNNYALRGWDRAFILWNRHPAQIIPYLTYALNFQWHGLEVRGFHVLNFLVHWACSVLVLGLLRVIPATPAGRRAVQAQAWPETQGKQILLALFGALLFLSHPVQTQAVTYVIQRNTSLAACFYLAAVFFYLEARLRGKALFYAGALLSSALAFFTKEISYSLPLMLLAAEIILWGNLRSSWKPKLLRVLPFFILLGVSSLLCFYPMIRAHGLDSATRISELIPRHIYFLTQFRVLLTYLRLLVWPIPQSFEYALPLFRTLLDPKTIAGLATFVVLAGFALTGIRRGLGMLSYGMVWFFVALSVESTVIPIPDVIMEHRLYLPFFGFSLIAAAVLWRIFRSREHWLVGVLCLTVAWAGILTHARNRVWATEVGFWEDAVRKAPERPRPMNNLGTAYLRINDLARARYWYEKALEREPGFAEALNNLGQIFEREGDPEKALDYYLKAAGQNPGLAEAYNNAGRIYGLRGEYDLAEDWFRKAVAVNPDLTRAYLNLGLLYAGTGDIEKEIAFFSKALAIDPDFQEAYRYLGIAMGKSGQDQASVRLLRRAVELDPRDVIAYYNLAVTYFLSGNRSLARLYQGMLQSLGENALEEKLEDLFARGQGGMRPE